MIRHIHLVGGLKGAENFIEQLGNIGELPIVCYTDTNVTVTTVQIHIDDPTSVDDEMEMIMWWMYDFI